MRSLVIVSANAEWTAVQEILHPAGIQATPLGETFLLPVGADGSETRFFHGGWGKISAAATAQYAIDRWQPDLLVNLGTCGGFAGRIERGAILLVEQTLVYDIYEQMGDPDEAIDHYATQLDLDWLGGDLPHPVRGGRLVSGDRDILVGDIPMLVDKYDAVAADWESGAIAWVANQNGVRCLILRGVTDLVSPQGGEAYGNIEIFHEATRRVMKTLLDQLPDWLKRAEGAAAPSLPLFQKVDCLRLHVPDLDAGLAFYRDRLGHSLIWRTDVAIGLRLPDSEAELVLQTERPGQEVDLTVRSADDAYARFTEAGGTGMVPPFDIRIGRAAVVRDPWGNPLVLLDTSKGLLETDQEGNVIGNL